MKPDQMTPAEPTDPPRRPLSRAALRRNRIIAVTGLVAVWILLWGTFTWANVIGGLVVATVLLAVFPLPPVTFAGRIHPLPMLRFWLRFLRDLVVASVQIAWMALRPGHTPRSAIIAVRLRVNTDLNLTLTAEALSLVPGSLILEADRSTGTLFVHVIGVNSRDEVERFRRGVLELEARIIAAIGSSDEQRRVREVAHPPPPADLEGVPT
ncbi:multicomponent Na+:H+ antiporter subunit E [Micromonospora phaseoli]|uniref:Multicomponent Na+:H+ antiporter subunit E n=1 Tax=Micromonospora phaseoli TaxID=1144548 RepID=A0A1H6U9R6_9ACTN|nr:Na+/H+ antiporter subunit E [Micromonospora phaseoli]PZV98936.1 multisubunit sodium/proton antiporter MrpE subunit [Micromonospora phaseoli]GIJ76313.1 Na+/H+ antiporter subunit E [Micromonospora phaseoli]SEI89123.1 multicomponent Na+:H+ antiporter subunit E [Micromonospora phaseoli]